MKGKELSDYISKVAELETAIFTQNRMLDEIDNKISEVNNVQYREYYAYKKMIVEEPEPFVEGDYSELIWKGVLTVWMIIMCLMFAFVTCRTGAIMPLFIVTGIIWGIGAIIVLLCKAADRKDYNKFVRDVENRNERRQHDLDIENKKIDQLNKSVQAENNELQNKALERVEVLRLYKEKLERILEETKETLKNFYSRDIIYPKYQNMIAVSSFNDYLKSGVCTELEGHEGCYNKFDVEIRLDTIINKMEDVLSNLELIRNNQHTLYIEVVKCNEKLDDLSHGIFEMTNSINGTLDEVKTQTISAINSNKSSNVLLEYYAEETSRNVASMKWLQQMDYIERGGYSW